MNVELRPIGTITPYPGNPRQNDHAVDAVAASIREFGFRQPIVVDEAGVIVVGETRWKAAGKLGLAEVPVHVARGLTPEQLRAYRIADNKTGDLADWDRELLAAELGDLRDQSMDLALLGFEPSELQRLLGEVPSDGLQDPDDVPEAPITDARSGDLWLLGSHRLVCGDARDRQSWCRLMDGCSADMVWTDPPYGLEYVGKTPNALTIENDGASMEALATLLDGALALTLEHCRPGAAWYVTAPSGPSHQSFAAVLGRLGVWRQSLVWVKDAFVLGHNDFHYRHEAMFYGWKPGTAHAFLGDRTQDTVWEFPRPRASREHPTMKPVALIQRAMQLSSSPSQIVVDCFGGSGSTLIAAERLGRRAFLMELDPRYCARAVTRWEEFTGCRAVRETVA